MPYKLNKIIFQRDHSWGYETHTHPLDTEIDFPFVAGKLQDLIPEEHQYGKKSKLELSTTPLFNESGLTKLIPEINLLSDMLIQNDFSVYYFICEIRIPI